MIVYAVVMLGTAGLFALLSVLIYRGKTELIHDYHRKKVADKALYGKAFGKALGVIAGALALSGVISLFGEGALWIAIGVLAVGFIIGMAAIVRVQKKYNGGVF